MSKIDRFVRTRHETVRQMLAEGLGTFLLVFISGCVGASYAFAATGDQVVSKIHASTFGAGLALFVGLSVAVPVSGGHLNPAVTVAMATIGQFPWARVMHFLFAQYMGAFVGSSMVYLTYYKKIHSVLDMFDANSTVGLEQTAGLFASAPVADANAFDTLVSSFWATAVLLSGIVSIVTQQQLDAKSPSWYIPLGVGLTLMVTLTGLGHYGGPNVNPAADFASRIFATMVGWKTVMWTSNNWWTGGIVGPHLGAIAAVWVYRVFVSAHYFEEEEEGLMSIANGEAVVTEASESAVQRSNSKDSTQLLVE